MHNTMTVQTESTVRHAQSCGWRVHKFVSPEHVIMQDEKGTTALDVCEDGIAELRFLNDEPPVRVSLHGWDCVPSPDTARTLLYDLTIPF